MRLNCDLSQKAPYSRFCLIYSSVPKKYMTYLQGYHDRYWRCVFAPTWCRFMMVHGSQSLAGKRSQRPHGITFGYFFWQTWPGRICRNHIKKKKRRNNEYPEISWYIWYINDIPKIILQITCVSFVWKMKQNWKLVYNYGKFKYTRKIILQTSLTCSTGRCRFHAGRRGCFGQWALQKATDWLGTLRTFVGVA